MWKKMMKAIGLGKEEKNGVVKNGVARHEPETEPEIEDESTEMTQEMLSEKFQRAIEAADAHAKSSQHLCDVTSAGGLNVADVLAAKKKAGIG